MADGIDIYQMDSKGREFWFIKSKIDILIKIPNVLKLCLMHILNTAQILNYGTNMSQNSWFI